MIYRVVSWQALQGQTAQLADVVRGTLAKVVLGGNTWGKTSWSRGNCGQKSMLLNRDNHA